MVVRQWPAALVVVLALLATSSCKEQESAKLAPAKKVADEAQVKSSTAAPPADLAVKTDGDQVPTPAARATTATESMSAGAAGRTVVKGVAFTAPGGWTKGRSPTRPRAAEFDCDGDGEAEVIILSFGTRGAGSREKNVKRWIGQFSDPSKPDGQVAFEERIETLNGLTHVIVRVAGEYRPGQMAPNVVKPDYALFGVIVEGGPEGPLYVKAIGPKGTIEAQTAAIQEFYRSAAIAE